MSFILGWILEDTEQKEVFVYLLRIEKKKKLKSWDLFLVQDPVRKSLTKSQLLQNSTKLLK